MTNPFEYHKPNADEIARIEEVREAYFDCMERLLSLTVPGSFSGRYVSLAKTRLEESCMWATKSIVFERDNDPDRVS